MSGSNTPAAEGATWWQAALMIRGQTEADQRNIRAIWVWTLVWGASFVAATTALARFAQLEGLSAWLVAMVPFVVGVPTVRVYLRFLREADEFMRKVQFEGIAMGFGAGSIFCIGYHTLEQVGAPALPMMAALLPMSFGWAIGSFLVAARYR